MMKIKKGIFTTVIGMAMLWSPGLLGQTVAKPEKYIIDPDLSSVKGYVKYTVVGKYRAQFEDYSGVFIFDPNDLKDSSVTLKINTRSIKSSYAHLDDIVRSKQILNAEQFPETIFQSKAIRKGEKENEYIVTGDLTLHGVTREIAFPFTVELSADNPDNQHVKASGVWIINRKDFGIIWNALLDKGGILVGNHLTVDWKIVGLKGAKDHEKDI
jgi:polyisoprenoid-binding protein YceI